MQTILDNWTQGAIQQYHQIFLESTTEQFTNQQIRENEHDLQTVLTSMNQTLMSKYIKSVTDVQWTQYIFEI